MRARPEGLEDGAIVDALRDGWGFDVVAAAYAPVGFGSYHWQVADLGGRRGFVTVDDLDQKAWLGDTRDVVFEALRGAFDTAFALRDSGLEFVVAPLATARGESLRRLDSRYAISLFPFVAGEPREFGFFHDDDDRRAVVELLARLHAAPVAGSAVRTAGFELPGRRHLEAALRDLDETWTGGPFSEPARAAVRESASELAELLALADSLAAEAQARGTDWVVTHGEPHAGNVLRTGGGLCLVDWDTVALGPPERDLWMVVDGEPADDAALDYFRLAWDLKDLAEYLAALRSPHREDDDTAQKYRALRDAGGIRERVGL